jgi:nucleotide-binding universal stress UspA family protein
MWSQDHEAEEEQKVEDAPHEIEALFGLIPEGIDYEARVTRGPLEDSLLFVSRGLPADLMVIASHGKSSAADDSGSGRIVIEAPCGVITIGEEYRPYQELDIASSVPATSHHVLVPIDFTPRSLRVLEYLIDLAPEMPYRIDLLHVLGRIHGIEQEELEVAAVRERLQGLVPEHLADRVSVQVRVGDISKQIQLAAEETRPRFILMGAHAKGLLKRVLFGTTTLGVLRNANCPVWFVPETELMVSHH